MTKTFGTPIAPPRFRWADAHWQALALLAADGARSVEDITERLAGHADFADAGASLTVEAVQRQLARLRKLGLELPVIPRRAKGPDIEALRKLIAERVAPAGPPPDDVDDDYPEAP